MQSQTKKEIWGIKIVPEKIIDESTHCFLDVNFATIIAPRSSVKKGELFATNKTVQSIIEKQKLTGHGSMPFIIDKVRKQINPVSYFPFGQDKHAQMYKKLKQTGIASFIEMQCIHFLAKKYPDYKYASSEGALKSRLKQVKKHSRIPGQAIPIKEAEQRIRNSIVKNLLKYERKSTPIKCKINRAINKAKFWKRFV